MGFPGVWMTESGSVAYRVVPKAACSTIGQILYYSDHGRFYDGDIHDADQGLHKWSMADSRPKIEDAVWDDSTPVFTCVRNPYARVVSAFLDKICGLQRNGRRYRGNLVPMIMQQYGVEVEGEFDQITSFRRFMLFARDTIRFRKPMEPDIHWSAQAGHVGTLIAHGGTYQHIFAAETFQDGMADILGRIEPNHLVDLSAMPRFNESADHGPKRAHPVGDYFDDLTRHMVWEVYRRDFDLFGYDPADPNHSEPIHDIDLDKVHRVLSQ
ncbi:MAG: sulfotransferase family protein [Pseudomonadota bacterium]